MPNNKCPRTGRPKKCRVIKINEQTRIYKPIGISACESGEVILSLDELEAMRYADYECYYHEQGAEEMRISRQTFGNILASGRKKVIDALLHGKVIRIEGGTIIKEENNESSNSGS